MKICPAYISKINSNYEKQIVLLMIQNKKKQNWHYLLLKNLSTLLREIISKHKSDSNCLNCLHSFATKKKLGSHKKNCKNKNFYGTVVISQKDNILQSNQNIKSDLR